MTTKTNDAVFKQIENLHLRPEETSGVIDFFFIPNEFVKNCRFYMQAIQCKSQESITDLKLKIINTPFQFTNSFFSFFKIIIQIGTIFKTFKKGIALVAAGALFASGAGFIACAITGVLECKNVLKVSKFFRKSSKNLELIRKDNDQARESLRFLESYINPPTEEEKPASLIKLSNRVMPWCAKKIEKELPGIIKGLEHPKGSREYEIAFLAAINLQKEALNQSKKKLIEHSLYLLAATISFVAFGALLFFPPALGVVITVLFAVSLGISLSNHLYSSGTKHHSGWEFKFRECFPSWIAKRLFAQN